MESTAESASTGPVVILGAGYAGLTAAHEIRRRGKGSVPVLLVDRHPVHVLRTELYEIGELAQSTGGGRWAVPIRRVLSDGRSEFRLGTVQEIDLARKTVRLDSTSLEFASLVICLGSVPAYYGIPGAADHTYHVYRLSAAAKFAHSLKEKISATPDDGRPPRVLVVGGGSTGTEISAEIATADWSSIVGRAVRAPEVILVTGAIPLLSGFPEPLVRHAVRLLRQSGVLVLEGSNVTEVEEHRIHLADGTILPFDFCAWSAGVEAPEPVRAMPVEHGKGGRLKVTSMLELADHPGVFAVGDVMEYHDPKTGMIVPATAQAALAEARVAGFNVVARRTGSPLQSFEYREKGAIVSVGVGRAAGRIRKLTIWGSPAALLKAIVQKEYSRSTVRGSSPSVL